MSTLKAVDLQHPSAASANISLGSTGNVTIPTSGARITGDFSNATTANRLMFQSSTTNGNTIVGALPNGTGTEARVSFYNSSDTANTSTFDIRCTATEAQLRTALAGTGTYLPMTFYTGGSERMRIDTSGNLQVGTSAYAYNVLLKSNASNYAAGVVNTNATSPYGLNIYLAGVTGGAGGGFLTCVDTANRLLIAGNGNVTNVNGSYGAISDAKLKENITDATPKLESLQQVRIVNFNMKGDEQKQIGVIAQELEQIFPNMVDETIDRDTDGNDLGTTTKNVKYSVFVPMLIKAIQELKAQNDELKARVATLEAK